MKADAAVIQQIDGVSFSDLTCKLDRILRLYKIVKNSDTSLGNEVRNRAMVVVKQMERIDANKFKQNQSVIMAYINESLVEPPRKAAPSVISSNTSKAISSASSVISKPPESVVSSNPFGSSIHSKTSKQSFVSSSSIGKNLEPFLAAQKPKETDSRRAREGTNVFSSLSKIESKIEESEEKSASKNEKSRVNATLKQYCDINGATIESKLNLNDEIMGLFKNQNPERVAVLGVQKPHDMNADKLYICTYMEFPKQQVLSLSIKDYQNEIDQFVNVIRYPLALCVIGQTISDMKAHYVKFLLEMTSPLPIVIIFNQVAPEKSLVIRLNDKVIQAIQNTSPTEVEKSDSLINMKDKSKYKCITLKDISVVKDKCVTTKILQSRINKEIIENDQAIMVETNQVDKMEALTPSQNNQPKNTATGNDFPYMMHAKFASSQGQQNFVYIIQENKQLNTRKKVKTLQEAVDFVKNCGKQCALGFIVKNNDKKILPEYFISHLKLMNKCPMMIIRYKNLTSNKFAFVTVRPNVTAEELEQANICFKDIQANQCPQLQVLLTASKGDFAKYETQSPLQQI